ncbi:MAG TPA: hypothetical protein DDX47_01950 [Candidatus Jacksonbacteria bacterium]|nr:hypothetical protein [Candidatus Jacksonbacteria bacterium]
MPLEKKADLISQIQAQGISKNIRQVALTAINAHIKQLEAQAVEADFKLRATLQQVASDLVAEFTGEEEKQEQLNIIVKEADRRMVAAEDDFNEEQDANEQILNAVELNLAVATAKSQAM